MRTIHRQKPLLALAAGALLCLSLPARAAVVEVLDKGSDTDSAKFEEYRNFDSGLRISFLRLLGESPDQEKTIDLTVINAPRSDARYSLTYAKPGKFTLFFDQNQIQHRFANNATTLWLRTGPGTLQIPDFVQAALQNGVVTNQGLLFFPYLNELVSPFIAQAPHTDLALQRDRSLFRLTVGSMSKFGWGLEVTHEQKHGLRAFGGSFGLFNVTEIPEPIDHTTNGAEVAGELKGSKGGLRFGYRYSKFKNNIDTVFWDNPFRLTDSSDGAAYLGPTPLSARGSSHGISDLPPDNDSNAVFVNGRAKLGKKWWVNGSVTRNTVKQNDVLLPYLINRGILLINDDGSVFDGFSNSTLPTQTADREVVTTNANAQLGGRFGLWDLTVRYRYYDHDNRSPVEQFVGYTLFHSTFIVLDRRTVSYSYTQKNASADLGVRLGSGSRLGLYVARNTLDREFREVKSSDEDIARLTLDTHPSDRWDLQASAEHGDRSISNYDVLASVLTYINPPGPLNNPDIRKLDEAARTYDSLRLLANLYATDKLNFTLGVSGRNESYDKSVLGLQKDDVLEYNAEISYTPSDKLNFFLFGTRTDRDSTVRSRESGGTPSLDPANDWQVKLSEITDTAGLGLNAKLGSRLTADLTGQWSRSNGNADFDRAVGTIVGFGNYDDVELLSLQAKLDYELTKNFSAGFSYLWEDYTISSFLTDNLSNYLPGAILLNGNDGNYRAHVVSINANLTW
jgi:MtrB/PioB family decaheme-associated outer membrane protein